MDTLQTVILITIIALVLVGIPVFLGRRTGQNPMVFLFGSRIRSEDPEKKAEKAEQRKKEANQSLATGSRNDLLNTVSTLASFVRKNHFYLVVPGSVQADGETARLVAVILTRSRIVGINCFGYGGDIQAYPQGADWTQNVNGEKKKIPSPVTKNQQQEEILKKAVRSLGLPEEKTEVLGVFTHPRAVLKSASRTGCCTRSQLTDVLSRDCYRKDEGLDPREAGKKLESLRPASH